MNNEEFKNEEQKAGDDEPKIENEENNDAFWYSFLVLIAIPFGCLLFGVADNSYVFIFLAFAFTIVAAIVGFLLWLVFRKKNKKIASGFLWGSILLSVILLSMAGACGLSGF